LTPTLAAIIGYLLLQFGIGLWVSRRIRTEADYLIAGRSLGLPLATFSIFATWFGAETVIGSAGATYSDGVSLGSAEPFGYGLCLILMGLVLAVPLWRRGLTTFADLFRQRYNVGVERLAAIILIPGSILWAAAQIRAFGQVLASVTVGLDVELAIAIATGVALAYTVLGGLLADAITDLVQGALLSLGLVLILIVLGVELGGFGATVQAVAESGRVQLPSADSGPFLATLEEWAIPVLGSVIATELVSRVIAAKSPGVAQGSALLAGGLYIGVGLIPVFVGLVGVTVVPGLDEPEQVVPAVAQALLHPFFLALFAGSLISAILSTVDSTLLVSSGLLSHNVLVPLLKETREERKVLFARLGVMAFGIVAYVLAVNAEGVFALVEDASAFGGGGVLVTVLFGLFTRLGGARTALATLIVGALSYLAGSYGGFAYPFLLSLVSSLVTYLVGSVGAGLRSSKEAHGGIVRAPEGASQSPPRP
jgi:Na+/proline symporter